MPRRCSSIPFDDFLSIAFGLSTECKELNPVFHTITTSSLFQKLLDEYPRAHEMERCHLFNKLANYISEELAKHYPSEEPSIIFYCNDHVASVGWLNTRTPDYFIVRESARQCGERSGWDNKGSQANPHIWSELLAFIKFNMKERTLGTLASSQLVQTSAKAHTQASTSNGISPSTDPLLCHFGDRESISYQRRVGEPSSEKRQRKVRDSCSRKDMLSQCANYTLGIQSRNDFPIHILGMLITDGELELLYHTRSLPLPVRSAPVDFLHDPCSLVALLYCIQQSTAKPFSYRLPLFSVLSRRDTHRLVPTHFYHGVDENLSLNDGVTLSIKPSNTPCSHYNLIGRGTRVVRISVAESNNKHSSLSFEPFYEVPCDKPFSAIAEDPQSSFLAGPSIQGIEFKDRALQNLFVTELSPVTMLTTADTLVPVIRDVFKCYKWLYKHIGAIHGDISPNNMMYGKEVNEDESIRTIHGMLIDHDLSGFFEDAKLGHTLKQRTGTQPYMAIELLQSLPSQHLYRHDLESLFYVIVVLTSRYDGGKEIDNPPLQAWFELGREGLSLVKQDALLTAKPYPKYKIPRPTPSFSMMDSLIFQMRRLFQQGFAAQTNHAGMVEQRDRIASTEPLPEYDDETLGGYVNFEKFEDILCPSSNDSYGE